MKKDNKFLLQQQQNELNGRNLCAVLFFFFLSACWGYLCIYDFLEETGGSALALCACQTEREATRVSMWVSVLATYWADEVFWTEKDEFPEREFIDVSFVNLVWTLVHCLSGFQFWELAGFWNFFKLWMQDFYRVHWLCESVSCSVSICPPAVFPSFMPCFGCVLASGWAFSAGTGSLCSGRTGCSTRSQQKSPVPFPKPCSMKPKPRQARITRISKPRTWILQSRTL